jgi:DNA-binding NtrC family response regulator
MPGKQTILLVDDEVGEREMLSKALGKSYSVLVAKDGIEAVCLYERNVERVAAVITDLDMPRLNGLAVAEWLHHIRPKLPVIIMSEDPDQMDGEPPMDEVYSLYKPFEVRQVEVLLSSLITTRKNTRIREKPALEGEPALCP